MAALDAEYFDGWYADMAERPRRDELFSRHLGPPPEFQSTSLRSFDGLLGGSRRRLGPDRIDAVQFADDGTAAPAALA